METKHQIDVLHISPGYFCNLSCAHCSNSSGPTRAKGMRQDELAEVIKAVRELSPAKLLFTGGEPTFHIEIINDILASHPELRNTHVTITTNGWYSRFPSKMKALLGSFAKLDAVQLSYDKWHKPALSKANILALSSHCKTSALAFSVQAAFSTPLDLIDFSEIQHGADFPMTMQAVEAVGRAKQNGIHAETKTFEKSQLAASCPNKNSLSFSPQLGFSVCCSNLMFNGKGKDFSNPSAQEHLDSAFYQEVTTTSLADQMERRGISFDDLLADSNVRSICSACEFIHCTKQRQETANSGVKAYA